MASNTGVRARGTDGGDFAHRESVASRYQRSIGLKKKLQTFLAIQVICGVYTLVVAVLAWDIPSILVTVGYTVGIPCGWYSLKRNNTHLINLYGVCCSVLGIFPMAFTLYCFLWSYAITSHHWMRFIEAVVVIATNIVSAYFAKELMQIWYTPSKTTKRK